MLKQTKYKPSSHNEVHAVLHPLATRNIIRALSLIDSYIYGNKERKILDSIITKTHALSNNHHTHLEEIVSIVKRVYLFENIY